ncbi:MAG TPA: hypothetical protein RMH99_01835, partial [Sandaracinaceae bacterium LLY-WYZ-13_1]|nr:hypothetical protein [Sandaracinaceae bacterium LLY-WYZ-13_1]
GGAGVLRVQVPGAAESTGPAVGLDAVPAIADAATVTLAGTAPANARVVLERTSDGDRTEVVADATGAFSAEVALGEGLNRFRVLAGDDGAEVRSWVGTSIELERRGDRTLPVGALVDVAWVP